MKKYANWYWLTVLGLLVIAFISRAVAGSWLSGFFLMPATLSVTMTLFYFGVLGFSKVDYFWSSGGTETFGLLENNGKLIDIVLFSDKFHTNHNWEIKKDKSTKDVETWLEHELNATWIGMPWNRQFRPVHLKCHKWNNENRGEYISGGTSEKTDHHFDSYVRIFHTHAYITDVVETINNFHVRGGFTFRFRIENPYLAFYTTSDVIDMLNAVAKGATRQIWAKKTFDEIRASEFETIENADEKKWEDLSPVQQDMMGYRLMFLMNAELKKYGLVIIDLHFVDLLNTEKDEEDALKALELAELKGQAAVKEATLNAKATIIRVTAEAEGERLNTKAFYDANDGNPKAMVASALSRMKDLRAFGAGSSLLIEDEKDTKPKIIKP